MADDWFRNVEWNSEIARRFEEQLGRARRKEQYLRIQACTLASTYPEVALGLLDRYFAMPDKFDHAQAHVDRATALKALGRIEDAADALEAALQRETEFANVQTQAYLELPLLVATECLRARFDRALAVLGEHVERLVFPVDHFRWHAARALILFNQGDRAAAVPHARSAITAASTDHSGFRHHPSAGLVGEKYRGLLDELAALGPA